MTGPVVRFLRGTTLLLGIAFILGGPTYVQLLGGRLGPFSRSWRMYTGVGRQLCEVRYTQILPDGRTIPVDRLEVLGIDRRTLHRKLERWSQTASGTAGDA